MDRSDWDERYATSELIWSADPNRWVREEVEGLPPGRAIDLAAGEGRNSIWMAGRGWRVTAVDFSSVALDKGRQLVASLADGDVAGRIEWVVDDARTYAPEAGAYDLVLLCYLQVPPGDRRQVLAHAVTALAPGGILLVVAHALANLTGGTGGPQDPAVLYDPEHVLSELPDTPALEVERAEIVRRPVEGARDALDTLVRARRPVAARP